MRVGLRLTRVLFLFVVGFFQLRAQPVLRELWARHDRFVLAGPQRSLPVDRAKVKFTFKGSQGQTVHGWDVGPKDAAVILSFAGGPGGSTHPERLGAGFPATATYRHLAIDVPGAGGSAWVPDWKPEDTVEDAESFLKRQGVQGQVYVSGWSWGSTMALLFAQRHPERVKGVVVGGVWTNTPEEVRSYLDADGQRAWMPALAEVFRTFSSGRGTACDLHDAIRSGRGGMALVKAYAEAESDQAGVGSIPRMDLPGPLPVVENPRPVDLRTEQNPLVRFTFIESEMMCRGQQGKWQLSLVFPKALEAVPLILIQGRYDQICLPEVAQQVFRTWPGSRKLLVPLNGGHASYRGPGKVERLKAGLNLTPEQEAQLDKALGLAFGNAVCLLSAAIDCLQNPNPGH